MRKPSLTAPRLVPLLVLLLAGLLPNRAQANSSAEVAHLRVELVAQEAAITPGHDLLLGLRFVLEKEWHIYWSNPGDSGEAPRVRWTLPAGTETLLHVGELRWPTPHRIVAGPLANYGYKDEVLLLAPLHVDGNAGAGRGKDPLTIIADVTWLVCSESCIPGKAQLTLTLPVQSRPAEGPAPRPGRESQTGLAALFAATQSALPAPPPPGWHFSGTLDADTVQLSADLGVPATPLHAEFLPLEPDQIENAAAQQSSAAGSILSLRLRRAEQLRKDITQLRGLLVIDSAGQPTRSFAVTIPLSSNAAPTVPPTAVSTGGASPGGTSPTATPPTAASPTIASPTAAPPIAASPTAASPTAAPLTAASPTAALPAPADPALAATGAPSPPLPLWLALVFAVLGGALLNLMPCVFPVLSIKALAMVQMSATDRGAARRHALAYTAGILVSFWVLAGLLIALRYTGQQIGWGFHLQSPRFLFILSALLFFLGLNLLGVFELGLGLTQLGQATVGRHGYAGAFATGVLATVVATPCTAPFMGTAVGFALSQPAPAALLIFSCLGIGLALPYLLLPWIPGLLRVLPRPGAWMETFKHAMGFLLLATVLWLAWVLGAQGGADAVVALLGGLLIVGIAGWVLHRWADRKLTSLTAGALVLCGALLPGWSISSTHLPARPAGAPQNSRDDLAWEPFSPERLLAYRRAGTPVFLDFTAEWCLACKVNERLVLRTPAVRARIQELGMVPMKADWTSYDPAITQALRAFGRSGIPFYVIYDRDANTPPIELPSVISTASVLRALAPLK